MAPLAIELHLGWTVSAPQLNASVSWPRALNHEMHWSLKQLIPFVDTLLYEQWDPIGVNSLDGSQGEYGGYAGQLLELALGGASDRTLAEFLGRCEEEAMGLEFPTPREHRLAVVGRLRTLIAESGVAEQAS